VWPGGVDGVQGRAGVLGRGSVGSGVSCLHQSGGDAPVPLCLQHVSGLFAVPFWQEKHPSGWFWHRVAGWCSIAAFTLKSHGSWTGRFVSSWTTARGVLIRYCVSFIAAPENPRLAILAICNARCMADCYSCTRPPCLAIIADMFKTDKKLVATLTMRFGYYLNHIRFQSLF